MSATKAPKATKAKTTDAKKPAKTPPAKSVAKKKLSALDAAAQVLAASSGSMSTKEMIEAMAQQKLWESPNGKTPAATLYAAILREINLKGANSRFKKTEPGRFAATDTAATTEQPIAEAKATKSKTPKGTKAKTAKKTTVKKGAEPAWAETPIPDGTPGPESLQELFRI